MKKKLTGILLSLLSLTALPVIAQEQNKKEYKSATNVSEAVSNYYYLQEKQDSLKAKQDSVMKVWEQRIKRIKAKQEKEKPE